MPKEEGAIQEIRTLIVDDEPLARSRLRRLLAGDNSIKVVAECVDAFDAVSAIQDESPDLVFLDIQIPEKDGFAVIDEVGVDKMPYTIFVTAYEQYAIRAFEVDALDYLLKPYSEERFLKALERAKRQLSNSSATEIEKHILEAVEQLRARPDYLERILIKTRGRFFFLMVNEVGWIKSEGNYLRLHVRHNSYLIRDTVHNLLSQIDPKRFLRINRATIVNVQMVKELVQIGHGDYNVILKDGTKLNLSRHYRENLGRFETWPA